MQPSKTENGEVTESNDKRSTQTERVLPAGEPETIRAAVRILRDGGVLAVPTDTVFGLVCLYESEAAIRRMVEIKGRTPNTKPLPLLLGSAAELPLVTSDVPAMVWPLIYAHWPGPLTIVFTAKESLSRLITAGSGTMGARVPANPDVLDILEAVGLPLASTSANRTGMAPTVNEAYVTAQLGEAVDLVVRPRPGVISGTASTVVDLTTMPALIRRRGDVTPAEIRQALGTRVDIAPDA
ncbi:MAG TPA: L-threonylcarbamoyladenylate synthase [Chloroflexota bacterium]|jgi:L-threonylcarbamoyladenylate synthase|nr:L-threonylcarbamoyladenylate synthase [Chloroflexota bacterium]